jgi:hypothetical protein
MKISGTGPTVPPDGVQGADEAQASRAASGKGLAEKVGGPEPPAEAARAQQASGPTEAARAQQASGSAEAARAQQAAAASPVADIVADLRAGKVSAQAALERVIDRVLAHQVGPDAPTAVREQVGAALRRALEEDPLLAEKLRALGA